jgi:NAD(P)-dependent dehydrogenase (short-subunit alcohol dehydrogenase family)
MAGMKKEHVLVVGGSKGTGRTIVRTMVQKGRRVSVVSRSIPEQKVKGARYYAADVSRPEIASTVADIVRRHGPLNHVVCAQQFRGEGDSWTGSMDVTLSGVMRVVEAAKDLFASGANNTIVIIGSITGRLINVEQHVGYHVAKAGIDHMVRYYALSLGPKGIRVNAVAPNTILKDENTEFYTVRNKKIGDLYASLSPLGRMTTAQDVADTVAFLTSDQSAAITGQTLVVDGGVTLINPEGLARRLAALDGVPMTQRSTAKV